MNTFEDNVPKFDTVSIKKGISEPTPEPAQLRQTQEQWKREEEEAEDLPDFLKNSLDQVEQESVVHKPSRLSIIQEIESVIENSNYEER
jgi:hypothetical protein